jgi:hypothetical protein
MAARDQARRLSGHRSEAWSAGEVRPGNDLTYRFPLILVRLHSRSCTVDGEAVACDDNGVNIPVGETRVLKHFQAQMPYGLFVPDVP